MDNHPIPQDVTNFQFKLIGDLTLKQFGYLVVSVILAWIFLLLPVFFFLKFFLALVSIGTGVLLAFVPFEGRPSDLMLLHFFKALFTPNQYIFQSGGDARAQIAKTPTQEPQKEEKKEENKNVFFQSSPMPVSIVRQPQETPGAAAFSNPIRAPGEEEKTPIQQPAQAAAPQAAQTTQNTAAQEKTLEEELSKAKQEEASVQAGTVAASAAHEKVQQLEQQLHEVFLQKQDLEKQILDLRQQLTQKQQQSVFTPSTAVEQPKETTHVLKVPKQLGKSVGLPIASDVPNLLIGIVKDSRDNVLPNILIEVKDKDGNAVRAFKTNTLGQFASATPLLNGLYTVSFEDSTAKHSFDSVEINATGEILLPIEVISVDNREKLRQELFG